jgi:NitT/TauT family transport system substrate-binding protein
MSIEMHRRALLTAGAALAIGFSTGAANATDKLRLAWSPAPQTPQIDVALANKLDVEAVTFVTGREAFEALIGGQADLATMAELPAVTGALRKQPFAIIADLGRYNGSRLITKASTGISKAADLAGKRVGVTLGTNTDFALYQLISNAGMTVERVNAAPPDLIAALARGDVDAIVPFPGFYTAAAKTLGDQYREIHLDAYQAHFVLAASTDALKNKKPAIAAVLSALVTADKFVAANPAAAAKIMATNLNGAMPESAILAQWQESDLTLRIAPELLDLLVAEGAWIASSGAIKTSTPTSASLRSFIDTTPLVEVDTARVTLK